MTRYDMALAFGSVGRQEGTASCVLFSFSMLSFHDDGDNCLCCCIIAGCIVPSSLLLCWLPRAVFGGLSRWAYGTVWCFFLHQCTIL